MIKILQNFPHCFFDLVAGKHHVYALVDRVFNFNCQDTRMAVKILSFPLKTVKPVRILQVERRKTSHSFTSLIAEKFFEVMI